MQLILCIAINKLWVVIQLVHHHCIVYIQFVLCFFIPNYLLCSSVKDVRVHKADSELIPGKGINISASQFLSYIWVSG